MEGVVRGLAVMADPPEMLLRPPYRRGLPLRRCTVYLPPELVETLRVEARERRQWVSGTVQPLRSEALAPRPRPRATDTIRGARVGSEGRSIRPPRHLPWRSPPPGPAVLTVDDEQPGRRNGGRHACRLVLNTPVWRELRREAGRRGGLSMAQLVRHLVGALGSSWGSGSVPEERPAPRPKDSTARVDVSGQEVAGEAHVPGREDRPAARGRADGLEAGQECGNVTP